MLRRRPAFWRSLPRRLTAVTALVAYLAAVVGVPIPANARKALACDHSSCGCRSADHVWNQCGCLSSGALIPESAIECNAPSGHPNTSGGCCPEGACFCCSDEHQGDAGNSPTCHSEGMKADPPPDKPHWVSTIDKWHCQGTATVWISLGAVTPPPPAVTWQPISLASDWVSSTDESPTPFALDPPVPPPRSSSL